MKFKFDEWINGNLVELAASWVMHSHFLKSTKPIKLQSVWFVVGLIPLLQHSYDFPQSIPQSTNLIEFNKLKTFSFWFIKFSLNCWLINAGNKYYNSKFWFDIFLSIPVSFAAICLVGLDSMNWECFGAMNQFMNQKQTNKSKLSSKLKLLILEVYALAICCGLLAAANSWN